MGLLADAWHVLSFVVAELTAERPSSQSINFSKQILLLGPLAELGRVVFDDAKMLRTYCL